jgi:hypothetical protein
LLLFSDLLISVNLGNRKAKVRMFPHVLAAIEGKSGDCREWVTEESIGTALKLTSRQNFDAGAGLDLKKQTGLNRAWDRSRSLIIAKGLEGRLSRHEPIEFGAVIVVDLITDQNPEGNLGVTQSPLGRAVMLEFRQPLAKIDRQHTTGAAELALEYPDLFPLLHAYVSNPANTLTLNIIRANAHAARKKFENLNFRPKAQSPVEQMFQSALTALQDEADGREIVDEAKIVSFMAWHSLAHNPQSVWFDKLVTDSTAEKRTPVYRAVAVKGLVDPTTAIYQIYANQIPDFTVLPLLDRAAIIAEGLNAFWESLRQSMPDAADVQWTQHLLLKTLDEFIGS